MLWKFWTIRKISFVSILVATSVAFVLVFTTLIPIAIFPAVRHAIGGLPVKITGFIFGPWIGTLTGMIAYLLCFALRPVVFHYAYIIVWMLTGFISGVIGWVFNRLWRGKNNSFVQSLNSKTSNVNFFITIFVLVISILILVFTTLFLTPDEFFHGRDIFHTRSTFVVLSCLGFVSMLLAIIIGRFFIKPRFFNIILTIVTFSAILEVITVPIMSFGDANSFLGEGDFLWSLFASFVFSPVRIWTNLFVIMIAYHIVSPLVLSKVNNGWTRE